MVCLEICVEQREQNKRLQQIKLSLYINSYSTNNANHQLIINYSIIKANHMLTINQENGLPHPRLLLLLLVLLLLLLPVLLLLLLLLSLLLLLLLLSLLLLFIITHQGNGLPHPRRWHQSTKLNCLTHKTKYSKYSQSLW